MKLSNLKYILASASLVFAVGCGGGGDVDAGPNTCTADANCGTGKVCHPVLKACVPSCTAGTDCPSSAKTCAKGDGSAATAASPGFCQCGTDALCNPGGASDAASALVCQPNTKQCTAKCTSSSSCNGGTCDTASGKCSGAVVVDAGTDAGVDAGMPMDAGVSCSAANVQPDVCGYSNACNSTMKCQPVPNDGTSTNLPTAFSQWPGATGTGNVIFNVVDEPTDRLAGCNPQDLTKTFTVSVYAYAGPGTTFPTPAVAGQGFWYYSPGKAKIDIALNYLGTLVNTGTASYEVTQNGKILKTTFSLCTMASETSLKAAFAFTNGNPYEITLTH
jgi:hypothetical protein